MQQDQQRNEQQKRIADNTDFIVTVVKWAVIIVVGYIGLALLTALAGAILMPWR